MCVMSLALCLCYGRIKVRGPARTHARRRALSTHDSGSQSHVSLSALTAHRSPRHGRGTNSPRRRATSRVSQTPVSCKVYTAQSPTDISHLNAMGMCVATRDTTNQVRYRQVHARSSSLAGEVRSAVCVTNAHGRHPLAHPTTPSFTLAGLPRPTALHRPRPHPPCSAVLAAPPAARITG